MNGQAGPIRFARMELADIPQVLGIDRQSFPLPWSEGAYRRELSENANSHFLVAYLPSGAGPPERTWRGWLRREPPRVIVGYVGFWYVVDEAHISTLAVHPGFRGQGIGARLLVAMLGEAAALGARLVTLEVRVSNLAAQRLYRKFGFEEVGRRKGYYRDNAEDALLMTLAPLERAWQDAAAGRRAAPGEAPVRTRKP
jgi:ribosomal-protein-alanine N-acetyltransferase